MNRIGRSIWLRLLLCEELYRNNAKEAHIMTMKWFKAAGIRALRTLAQTALGCLSTAALLGDVDWLAVASASALSAIISILMSLAGLPEVDNGEGE